MGIPRSTTSLALVSLSGCALVAALAPVTQAAESATGESVFQSVPELGDANAILAGYPAGLSAQIDSLPSAKRAALESEVDQKIKTALSEMPTAQNGVVAVEAVAAAPPKSQQRAMANAFMSQNLSGFLSFRAWRRAEKPFFEWSSDGCSVPAAVQDKIKVTAFFASVYQGPCTRHDFGYRNFGNRYGKSLNATEAQRASVDARLLSDCVAKGGGTVGKTASWTFALAVRKFGGPAFF